MLTVVVHHVEQGCKATIMEEARPSDGSRALPEVPCGTCVVASNVFRVRASVRTTPLTWGCRASVVMSIRIRPLSSDRAEIESVSTTSPCYVSIV